MATVAAQSGTRSAKQEFIDWLRERIRGDPEVDLPALVAESEMVFPAEFYERLGREQRTALLYALAGARLRPVRTREALERLRARAAATEDPTWIERAKLQLASWYEFVGPGRKISIVEMTEEDVRNVISIRERRGQAEMRVARYFRQQILPKLVGTDKKVGEVIPEEELLDGYYRYFNPNRRRGSRG